MSEKKSGKASGISFEALSSLDAPVSFWRGIPFGLQHVMAMFVANLAPIFIVASAANMTPEQSATVIQAGLLTAGLGTCLQLYGAWMIGSRLPWRSARTRDTAPWSVLCWSAACWSWFWV